MALVVFEEIRKEAAVWEGESSRLAGCSTAAAGLHFSGLQWGIFAPIVGVYNEVADLVAKVTGEGSTEVTAIGGDLRMNADAYEGIDQERRDAGERVIGAY
jgi:hypothetical protein